MFNHLKMIKDKKKTNIRTTSTQLFKRHKIRGVRGVIGGKYDFCDKTLVIHI